MRGKQEYIYGDTDSIGITPAHAGKTMMDSVLLRIRQDHPRACGENFVEVNCVAIV